jgi:lactoylglutathione lyase
MHATNLTPELLVENIEQTINFYTKVLEFETVMTFPEEEPFFAIIKNSGVTIMLYERKPFGEEIPAFKNSPIGGTVALFIEVSDLDTSYEKIKDQVKIIQTPHETSYGTKEISFEDCNGYVIILNQKLHGKLV